MIVDKIKWDEVRKYPVSSHTLVGSRKIHEYCMGGNAIVTLISPTGISYSYYIRNPWMEDKEDFPSDIRFVYVSRDGKWIYLGEMYGCGSGFRLTGSSNFHADTPEFRGMMYIVKMMNRDFNTNMVLQHEGCCSRCGRRLIDPLSIERGIGPKCYKYLHGCT